MNHVDPSTGAFACTCCNVVLDPAQLDQIEASSKPLLVFCFHCCHCHLYVPGAKGIRDLTKDEAEKVRANPHAWALVQRAWKEFEPRGSG